MQRNFTDLESRIMKAGTASSKATTPRPPWTAHQVIVAQSLTENASDQGGTDPPGGRD